MKLAFCVEGTLAAAGGGGLSVRVTGNDESASRGSFSYSL